MLLAHMLLEASANSIMPQDLAALDLRQALFDLTDEPAVVIDEALDRLSRQRFGVAAPLVG